MMFLTAPHLPHPSSSCEKCCIFNKLINVNFLAPLGLSWPGRKACCPRLGTRDLPPHRANSPHASPQGSGCQRTVCLCRDRPSEVVSGPRQPGSHSSSTVQGCSPILAGAKQNPLSRRSPAPGPLPAGTGEELLHTWSLHWLLVTQGPQCLLWAVIQTLHTQVP